MVVVDFTLSILKFPKCAHFEFRDLNVRSGLGKVLRKSRGEHFIREFLDHANFLRGTPLTNIFTTALFTMYIFFFHSLTSSCLNMTSRTYQTLSIKGKPFRTFQLLPNDAIICD